MYPDSDFCNIVRSLDSAVLPGKVTSNYRWRWQLYFAWVELLAYGFRGLRAAKGASSVVVYTHLVLLPFLLARTFGFKPNLVLVSFIYTQRRNPVLRTLRETYFRLVLSRVASVVVHSTAEVVRYRALFPACEFVFVPLWAHMSSRLELEVRDEGYLVSAGRSNRDYDTLLGATGDLKMPVKIICDSFPDRAVPPNVEILRNCHEVAYLRVMAGARVVVIPLKSDGESSGQMVLLHAMALGKPIVITSTSEVSEYVESGVTALCVERGSVGNLVLQIRRLCEHPDLARTLGVAASARYRSRHTLEAGLATIERIARGAS